MTLKVPRETTPIDVAVFRMPNEYNVPKANQLQHSQIMAEDKGKASSIKSLKVLLIEVFISSI